MLDKISSLVLVAIGTIVWMMVGFVIAVPYTWAAGGDVDSFGTTVLISPAALIFLLFVSLVAYWNATRGKVLNGYILALVLALLYFTMPITLNGIAVNLELSGFRDVAHYFHILKYPSLIIIPAVLILSGIGHSIIAGYLEERRQEKPPTGRGGQRGLVETQTSENEEPQMDQIQFAV